MDKCSAKNLLIENGLKLTSQRELLLDTIINSDSIFSAISLQEKVNASMDLVTIYRILTVFLNKNIIREVIPVFMSYHANIIPFTLIFFVKNAKV